MFRSGMTLFRLFGLEVRLHPSWIFLAVLLMWSLSAGYFPYAYKGLETSTYWIMGLIATLLLFASIIIHESAHALVARKRGMPVRSINLFIFGGVADMAEEPDNPRTEFLMAFAGPLASIILSALFFTLGTWGEQQNWPAAFYGIIDYLGRINLILAIFNLLPGFPLDGGRVLRSILWGWKKDLRWATHRAVQGATVITFFLIFLGIVSFIGGNIIGGIWLIFIGMFLNTISKGSEYQLIIRQTLSNEPLDRVINTKPVTLSPDMPVQEAIDQYFYKYHTKFFPVTEGDKLKGSVSTEDIRKIKKEDRKNTPLRAILSSTNGKNTLSPQNDLYSALQKINRHGGNSILVVDGDRLIGTLSLKDIMDFLSVKTDIEDIDMKGMKLTPT